MVFYASRNGLSYTILRQKFRPFVSSNLDAYLDRYWAVVFTVGSRPIETCQMRQYLSWYCTRGKVVELDHHLYANTIRRSIVERTGFSDLPILFVHKSCVGTLREVQALEKKKLLKDTLQFGFQWRTKSGADLSLHTLPATYNDTECFRARYRGPPVAKPVVQLPSLHPMFPVENH